MRMLRGKRSELIFADTARFGFLILVIVGRNRMFWIPLYPFLTLGGPAPFLRLPRGNVHRDGSHGVSLSVHTYFHV